MFRSFCVYHHAPAEHSMSPAPNTASGEAIGPDGVSGLILGLRQTNETALHCNDVSHWLGANLESVLRIHKVVITRYPSEIEFTVLSCRHPHQSFVVCTCKRETELTHDDVIKWEHFPPYWPFLRGIHRSRWIPLTKASDADLWSFLWSAPE